MSAFPQPATAPALHGGTIGSGGGHGIRSRTGALVPDVTTASTPLSVLDLAPVGAHRTTAAALAATTAAAVRADELGYARFWVAEHHGMPSVASTSPPVLVAHLAAATRRIRVGSGGVMLPNHAPLVVAEQFAMLEALHPGRIDLGIGRAPGTDPLTAAALRRSPDALGAEDFPSHLLDLMGLLGDVRADDTLAARFAATPAASSFPSVVLLGSSGYSAQLAGVLGLPFAFAHHFGGGGVETAVELYRTRFRPSAVLAAPHAIVTASVLVADTEEQAHHLAGPGQLMRLAIRSGRFDPLATPGEAAASPSRELAAELDTTSYVGTPAGVVPGLAELVARTGADELMVTTVTYGADERVRSLELLSAEWRRARPSA